MFLKSDSIRNVTVFGFEPFFVPFNDRFGLKLNLGHDTAIRVDWLQTIGDKCVYIAGK